MLLQAVGNKIHVKIDKKKQKAKLQLSSGIIIPIGWEFMQYFLQYGEIVSVGGEVDNPDIIVGRTAIFHHRIEADMGQLMCVLPDGDEIRVIRTSSEAFNYQFYGVFDEEGNILPQHPFVFVWPEKREGFTKETMINPDTREIMEVQVRKRESGIYTAEIEKEEASDRHINCEVAAVFRDDKDLKKGDMIMASTETRYNIDLPGARYWILQKEFIVGKLLPDDTEHI